MNYPLEALSWHESKAEGSDETILAQRSKFALVEKRPATQPMTDTERLEWFGEYCDRHEYIKPSHVIVDCLGQRTVGANFRDAIDMAAAKFKAANE